MKDRWGCFFAYIWAIPYNINLRESRMALISVQDIEALFKIFEEETEMSEHFKKFHSKYKVNFNYDLPQNVL